MHEVTLAEILCAREERARMQAELIQKYSTPLVCFTMNIAGPVKLTPSIERAFYAGLEMLDRRLENAEVLTRQTQVNATGCVAFYAVKKNAETLKKICTQIEESCPLGRIFDIDVIDTDMTKLQRQTERSCLVCSAPGRACAAGRLHSWQEVSAVTQRIITEHFFACDKEYIADCAEKSLIKELYTTPKPGLVDRRNNGSHADMNIDVFIKSAHALRPYFLKCVEIGKRSAENPPEHTFSLLREAGKNAEKSMYAATGGVNTHKGIIYSMGIICGAVGRLYTPELQELEPSRILAQSAEIARLSAQLDLSQANGKTAGEKMYIQHAVSGIRGEAALGFPSVAEIALPSFLHALNSTLCENDAGVYTLLRLIETLDDTTLYNRGGEAGVIYARNFAKDVLARTPFPSLSDIEKMDDAFIERNLSVGGCADLLALTYFLHMLSELHNKKIKSTDA